MYFASAFFRAKARAALKGRWQTALLIALIVSLPSLLAQAIVSFTGNDLMTRLGNLYLSASRDGILTQQLLQQEIDSYITDGGLATAGGLNLAAFLITPFLALGMYKWMLDRVRGMADEPVSTVFCRAPLFFKAIGLRLLTALRILLWMLPGAALLAASMIPVWRAGNEQEALNAALRLSNAFMFPAIAAMVVPGVMAALRYAMSEFILADEPETGILECIRRSKKHMQEMKRMLFTLVLSFILWYLLGSIVSTFLSFGSNMVSLIIQMLVELALTAYISASEAAFYLETMPGRIPKHSGAEEDPAGTGDEDQTSID